MQVEIPAAHVDFHTDTRQKGGYRRGFRLRHAIYCTVWVNESISLASSATALVFMA